MNASTKSRHRAWLFTGILLLIFVPFILLQSRFLREPDSDRDHSTARAKKEVDHSHFNITNDHFQKRAHERHVLLKNLVLEPDQRSSIENRCSSLNQHEQLKDIKCTALWLFKLKHSEIVQVKTMWGFEDTHYGAITFLLEGNIKAMFKPCSTRTENTGNEVIASHLNQLLGWGQVPPIIGRKISIEEISLHLTSEKEREILAKTVELCEKDGHFIGPIMGWMDGLIPIRTVRKYKDLRENFVATRKTLGETPYTTQMMSQLHAFYWLIHILRHGKDEFVLRSGDLVALDLDRARIDYKVPIDSMKINFSWCFSCYMSRKVYNSFKAFGPDQPPLNRLGALLEDSLSYEDLMPNLWDEKLSQALDYRVSELLRCINSCIQTHGEEKVLLSVPRTDSDYDLVRWYIQNSQYKHQNGQMAPPQSILEEFDVHNPKFE